MSQLTKQVNTSLSDRGRERPLRFLIACERSQVEQSAFAARGAEAWSLDIAPWVGGGKKLGVAHTVCGVPRKLLSQARSQSFPGVAAAMADQWLSFSENRCHV